MVSARFRRVDFKRLKFKAFIDDIWRTKGYEREPLASEDAPGTSEFDAYRDESANPPALVVQVGKTQLKYDLRCINDLHSMLKKNGGWMELGSADEQKPAAEGRSRLGNARQRILSGDGMG